MPGQVNQPVPFFYPLESTYSLHSVRECVVGQVDVFSLLPAGGAEGVSWDEACVPRGCKALVDGRRMNGAFAL